MLRRESQYSTSAFNCESWVTPLTAIYLFVCYHQSSKSHSSIETKLPKRFCLLLPLCSKWFSSQLHSECNFAYCQVQFPWEKSGYAKKKYTKWMWGQLRMECNFALSRKCQMLCFCAPWEKVLQNGENDGVQVFLSIMESWILLTDRNGCPCDIFFPRP